MDVSTFGHTQKQREKKVFDLFFFLRAHLMFVGGRGFGHVMYVMLGFYVLLAAMELEHISSPACSSNSSTRVSQYLSLSLFAPRPSRQVVLSFSFFPVMTHSPVDAGKH